MERYKLILAYDGSAYSGSQRQTRCRTVQAELEKALRSLGWKSESVLMAGRTDAGVHAAGQVAAFDFEWRHGGDTLRDALNARLPADVAVQSVEKAPADFHPRFDATSRRYRYRIYCQAVRDPLREQMAWQVWPPVDARDLSESAGLFVGSHDFSAFGSASRRDGSTRRTVVLSKWAQTTDEFQFEIMADAFLYRMVRRLVFVQVAVSQGRSSRTAVIEALRAPARGKDLPAGLAPAHGLVLVEVKY